MEAPASAKAGVKGMVGHQAGAGEDGTLGP